MKPPHPLPPLEGGRCEKIGIFPLTLPSPARGEGKYIEIQEKIPFPSTGEGKGGGENGIFSHLRGGKGGDEPAQKVKPKTMRGEFGIFYKNENRDSHHGNDLSFADGGGNGPGC